MPSDFPAADSPDSSSQEVKMLHLLEQLEMHAQRLGSDPEISEPRRSYWKGLFLTLDLYGDRIKALKRMDG